MARQSGLLNVALLSSGWKPGTWTHPLNIPNHGRHLSVVSQTDKFTHERNSGTRGRRHRTCTGPGSTNHHPDRGQLIFSLNAGILSRTISAFSKLCQISLQRFSQRTRGRNRIPGKKCTTAINGAQSCRDIPLDHDFALIRQPALHPEGIIFLEIFFSVLKPHIEGGHIRIDSLLLVSKRIGNYPSYDLFIDAIQMAQRGYIEEILEQMPELWINVFCHLLNGNRINIHPFLELALSDGNEARIVED